MTSQASESARPKLVVFDLDRTLWPFWVDTQVLPPFRKKNGEIFDRRGKKIQPFPEVAEVLEWLHSEGFLMAAASRTRELRGAKQLINLFGWEKYLKLMEIYPGCKTAHFTNIHKESKIPLSEMLFFDDEERNIHDLTRPSRMTSKLSETSRPKLIVFDLDFTLWPFAVDIHFKSPFHEENGEISDSAGRNVRPFPDVSEVLEWLQSEGYAMAAASRSGDPVGAKQLVKLFGWEKYFKYMEIYPGCKKMHFSRLYKQSKMPLSDMIFFDDNGVNIRDLSQVGVVSILVSGTTGINKHLVREGLAKFARERRNENHGGK